MAFVPDMMTSVPDQDTRMAADAEWQERTKNLLKAELKRRGVSYKELADKLGEIGVRETEANIKNKISRGGFTAVFLLQVLVAVGAREIRVD
jgi:hypothetical protein